MIAKNPCFHPGDMRTFRAVDNLALHHMVDVVVFPIKGLTTIVSDSDEKLFKTIQGGPETKTHTIVSNFAKC